MHPCLHSGHYTSTQNTQIHLAGCTDRLMLTEQEMSLCEASLIYPKPSDLELLSSDGAANGLPHQREWLHNSQSGALCLSLLFSPGRRKDAKNIPNFSALSHLISSFRACQFLFSQQPAQYCKYGRQPCRISMCIVCLKLSWFPLSITH